MPSKILFAFVLQIYLVTCQDGEPLFLTPLIKAGNITEAQRLSKVGGFLAYPEITSYSGFITVNEEYNSNLFFWFFPAQNNSTDAPVWLWSEGGPGITGLHSLFSHNGPYFLEEDKHIRLRNNSWHMTQNIVYLDSPVGVGFSFTQNEAAYVKSSEEAAPAIYEFLLQFFQLFPHLAQNDFYNGGVSYGASYASVVANYIHTQNQNSPNFAINLKGILLESPWVDPISQFDYSTYLHNVAIIDDKTKRECDVKADIVKEQINQGNYLGAFATWQQLVGSIPTAAGFYPMYNIIKDTINYPNFTDLVNSESGRRSLHVGNMSFSFVSPRVQGDMHNNFMASVKSHLESVLNAGYKGIMYVGNLDAGLPGVADMVKNLNWDGAEELNNSTRGIWRVDGKVAGYLNSARNANYIVMRNAGHGCNGDQPEWGFDLVNRFTKGDSFIEGLK
ncbi:venom serine carboxypeptidase [Folsomia candida]|uniref:Venom serine carboxypeptidase n=1 Tax=Folsomia candida TaxID=158441 RepID=A0A226D1R7_FOLCA|nr:venom serine carboxypeptidase [Folsomia candida]OXA38581.1 Venom serine carboxypeptidase [Folsomia candida]